MKEWTGEHTYTQMRYPPVLYLLVILFQSMTYILNCVAVLVRFKLQCYVNIFFLVAAKGLPCSQGLWQNMEPSWFPHLTYSYFLTEPNLDKSIFGMHIVGHLSTQALFPILGFNAFVLLRALTFDHFFSVSLSFLLPFDCLWGHCNSLSHHLCASHPHVLLSGPKLSPGPGL